MSTDNKNEGTMAKNSKSAKASASETAPEGTTATVGNAVGVSRDVTLSEVSVKVGWNMRHFFSQPEIEALAASLKSVGQLSNIVVAEREDGKGYWLVAGEKRTRAARLAGITKLRAWVISEKDAEQAAIDENFRRSDVSMPDRCMFVKTLREQGKTNDEIATKLGLSPQTTSNDYTVVTKLHPSIFEQWAQRPGASKVVLSLASKPHDAQLSAWAHYVEHGKLPKKESADANKPGKGELERAYSSATLAREYSKGRTPVTDEAWFAGVAWALEYVAGAHTDPSDGEASWPDSMRRIVELAKAPPKQVELFAKPKAETPKA